MSFCEEAQQNIHQHVYEIIRQQIKGCTTCVPYTHEKNCYETTKSSTGRKNLYEINWPLWWNRGATTTTDTICADNLNVGAWLVANKEIHHSKVGAIWRRQKCMEGNAHRNPNLTFKSVSGEISHKEYAIPRGWRSWWHTTRERTPTTNKWNSRTTATGAIAVES